MTDTSQPPRLRASQVVKVAVAATIGAMLVIGLIALRNDRSVRASFAGSETVRSTAASASPTRRRTPLVGRGNPVDVSGRSPITAAAVGLSDLRGKPVVLVIWASWCPGCNSEAPHLQRVAASRSDVQFFGINYRDSARDAQAFVRKYRWQVPSVQDGDGAISERLGLQGTPTTIFLDVNHREIGRVVGPMDEAGLREAIDQVVGA